MIAVVYPDVLAFVQRQNSQAVRRSAERITRQGLLHVPEGRYLKAVFLRVFEKG